MAEGSNSDKAAVAIRRAARTLPPSWPPVRGFHGKLPSCGDFVRDGLPQSFTEPWEAWLQSCLASGRRSLGADWTMCWLAAPVWRFVLPAGLCGPLAAVGTWVPSVDRVGRDFPLTVAAVAADLASLRHAAAVWLDVAETAACHAVMDNAEPAMLAAALAPPAPGERSAAPAPFWPGTRPGAVWWTQGEGHAASSRLATRRLPDPAMFAHMVVPLQDTV